VSPFFPDGVDPRAVSAGGRPANPEDLLIAYALGVPYAGQHGDDQKRWEQRFGDLIVNPADSLGLAPAPPARRQAQLAWARALCDAAMDAASRRGVAVAVCERAGISLLRPPADAVEEAIAEAYGHKPSMLQDVLARRGTEIDALNGGVAAEGRRIGVPTPLHDCMVALVKGLEKSWSD
jgi:Ketopantoate reductase PanE/ApbA C terminal